MKYQENNYQAVIQKLEELSSIHASDSFKKRVKHTYIPSLGGLQSPYRISSYSIVRFALVLAVALLLSGSAMVVASEKTYPGDFFYPVKTFMNSIQHVFTPETKNTIKLDSVDKKISDIKHAAQQNDHKEIQRTAKEYEQEVEKVRKAVSATSTEVNDHMRNNAKQLQEVEKIVPSQAQPAIQHAIVVSTGGVSAGFPCAATTNPATIVISACNNSGIIYSPPLKPSPLSTGLGEESP